jgi:DNA-directed RNA polymerase specialized sigma24 family protein
LNLQAVNISTAYNAEAWQLGSLARRILNIQDVPGPVRAISARSGDAILVEGTLDGNERAFRLLVERHQGAIVRTVTGMLGDTQEVDDTVQEVFIRFYAALRTFRAEASVRTFLTRIAINRSLDVLRIRRRREFLPWEHETAKEVESKREAIQQL